MGGGVSIGTAHPALKDVYKVLGVRGPTLKHVVHKLLGGSKSAHPKGTPKDVYKPSWETLRTSYGTAVSY